jgi:hypothetical protein
VFGCGSTIEALPSIYFSSCVWPHCFSVCLYTLAGYESNTNLNDSYAQPLTLTFTQPDTEYTFILYCMFILRGIIYTLYHNYTRSNANELFKCLAGEPWDLSTPYQVEKQAHHWKRGTLRRFSLHSTVICHHRHPSAVAA